MLPSSHASTCFPHGKVVLCSFNRLVRINGHANREGYECPKPADLLEIVKPEKMMPPVIHKWHVEKYVISRVEKG